MMDKWDKLKEEIEKLYVRSCFPFPNKKQEKERDGIHRVLEHIKGLMHKLDGG